MKKIRGKEFLYFQGRASNFGMEGSDKEEDYFNDTYCGVFRYIPSTVFVL